MEEEYSGWNSMYKGKNWGGKRAKVCLGNQELSFMVGENIGQLNLRQYSENEFESQSEFKL